MKGFYVPAIPIPPTVGEPNIPNTLVSSWAQKREQELQQVAEANKGKTWHIAWLQAGKNKRQTIYLCCSAAGMEYYPFSLLPGNPPTPVKGMAGITIVADLTNFRFIDKALLGKDAAINDFLETIKVELRDKEQSMVVKYEMNRELEQDFGWNLPLL